MGYHHQHRHAQQQHGSNSKGQTQRRKNKNEQHGTRKSCEELFMQAEIALMSEDLAQAEALYKECVLREPENVEFLDGYGSFLAEFANDRKDEAIKVLQKACDLAPMTGFEKFMYLGQVLDACGRTEEAEAAMRQGVGILRNMDDENSEEYLTSALCSLAELLMGLIHDALDEAEDDSEEEVSRLYIEVESLLHEAGSGTSKNPEPLQALCSLRVIQGREEEALGLLKESLQLWWDDDDDDEEEEDEDGNGDEKKGERMLPSYEFRFETAKLLLELDDSTATAADILEGLLEENDAVPDVWLLLAVAYKAGGELESAAEAATQGAKIARLQGYSEQDNEVVYALEELEKELTSK